MLSTENVEKTEMHRCSRCTRTASRHDPGATNTCCARQIGKSRWYLAHGLVFIMGLSHSGRADASAHISTRGAPVPRGRASWISPTNPIFMMKNCQPHERVVVDVTVVDIQRITSKWRAHRQRRQQSNTQSQTPAAPVEPVQVNGEQGTEDRPVASAEGGLSFRM